MVNADVVVWDLWFWKKLNLQGASYRQRHPYQTDLGRNFRDSTDTGYNLHHIISHNVVMPPPSKRGLAWPWNNPKKHFEPYQSAISSNKLSWLTNWELWKPDGCPDQLEYVPMVRTAKEVANIDPFLTGLWGADQKKAGDQRHFLGFNEPDIPSQANLSVAEVIDLWHKHVVPARQKFKFRLGAPAVSSAPEGRIWLRGFFDALGEDKSKIAFLPLHWYGRDVGELEAYLRGMHEEFGKPLWVTEFACVRMDGQRANAEEVEGFMNASLVTLDNLEIVERYAWFGAMDDPGEWTGNEIALTETKGGKGSLKRLGRMYCEL